jgi:hypothetical protein
MCGLSVKTKVLHAMGTIHFPETKNPAKAGFFVKN